MASMLLLHLVLIALVLACVPIGASRGGFREGLLGGGLVVTGALAISPPAEWLRDVAGSQSDYGRLSVSLLCLGAGLLIGLGAGKVVERHANSSRGRLLGAICGLANGLWVVTFLLGAVGRNAERTGLGDRLTDTVLVEPLAAHGEITLLMLSTIVLLLSGLWTMHLLWNRLGGDPLQETNWTSPPGNSSRHRAIHLPIGADTGKLEPAGSARVVRLSSTVTVGWNRGNRRRDQTARRTVPADCWYAVPRRCDAKHLPEDGARR